MHSKTLSGHREKSVAFQPISLIERTRDFNIGEYEQERTQLIMQKTESAILNETIVLVYSSPDVHVAEADGMGLGLFASRPLAKGTAIPYLCKTIPNEIFHQRYNNPEDPQYGSYMVQSKYKLH